jgi:hypothetical protein
MAGQQESEESKFGFAPEDNLTLNFELEPLSQNRRSSEWLLS